MVRAPRGSTTIDRFWFHVDQPSPEACWQWLRVPNRKGYGTFGLHGRQILAHRFAYEATIGLIPVGLQLDHLCRNPGCVNPAHLEPVTNAENIRRRTLLRTHCPHGHEYTPENTYRRLGAQGRGCRACTAAAQRRYQARLRSA